MADDADKESKTEEATEQKIRDALEKGNMPFSRETPILAGIASFLIIAVFVAGPATTKLAVFLRELIDRPEDWLLNSAEDASRLFGVLALAVGAALVPVFIIIPLAGIAASAFQNAPRFVGERIRPQASRISPLKGWQRIFGRSGQVEFLKSLAKFLAASVIVFVVFSAATAFSPMRSPRTPAPCPNSCVRTWCACWSPMFWPSRQLPVSTLPGRAFTGGRNCA